LDTGIDNTHPEFSGRILKCNNEIYKNPNTCNDKNGHGTHVAGIAGAAGVNTNAKGVAPEISFYIDQVLNNAGSGSLSGIIAGIERSVDNGAKVISMSLGTNPITTTQSNCDTTFPAFTAAINAAVEAGVTVVAAAGNSGTSGVGAPGCISSTIAVAAVNSADTIASFSSRGGAVEDHGIAAPGVSIYSSYKSGGYATLSGTSMATPHVAGTIALMIKSNPSLTPVTIKSTLLSTACNSSSIPSCPTGTVPNSDYGYGRVDALAAYNVVTTPDAPTDLTATAVSDSQIDLSWTAPTGSGTILGYYLERSDAGSFIDPPYISNLLSYWKFDGNDQATTDFGSLANTATLTGTKNLASGQIHRAFSFDGSSYVTVNDESDYDFDRINPFSVAFWLKGTNTGVMELIVAKGNAATPIWRVNFNPYDALVFAMIKTVPTDALSVKYSTNLRDGLWHHVVVTYSGSGAASDVKMYVDGAQVSASIALNTLTSSILNNAALSIGAGGGGTNKFTGQLDDLRIYNKELTSAEVSKLYAVTAQTTTSKSDMGLTSGTTYYYQVLALNDYGEGAVSNTASATTDTIP